MGPRARAVRCFSDTFWTAPARLVRAPGRVNAIGEHTDDNDGYVLPAAIDRELWTALGRRDDAVVEATVHVGRVTDGVSALDPAAEPA